MNKENSTKQGQSTAAERLTGGRPHRPPARQIAPHTAAKCPDLTF
jgi:hypothetical protein